MNSSTPKLRIGSRPLWLRADRVRQRYPTLRGSCEVEYTIVGGGATGATAAALFADEGMSTAVLEAELVGRGSTGASSALLLQEPDMGLTEMSDRYGAQKAQRAWHLSASAVGGFVNTLKRFHVACNLTHLDSVYYTKTAEGVDMLQSELKRRKRSGLRDEWLTPGALRRLTGISGLGGLRTGGNAQIDPYKASLGLLHAATARGAQIFERTRVTSIEQYRQGVRLTTNRGSVTARRVVIATGYATREFRPLAGHFRLEHTYVLATPRITGRQQRELGLSQVMLWDTERPYHYARWTSDRRLLLGGGDRPIVSAGRRTAAFARGTAELRRYFESLFPALTDIGVEFAWEGLFAKTADTLPYIGPHRRYPRHLFALGYGGNGMTFGYLAACMLLEQVQGIHSSDHALFAFGRDRGR